MSDGRDMLKETSMSASSRHDTLYCTEEQINEMIRASGVVNEMGVHANRVDNLKFYGLEIEVLPRYDGERAILCKKGDLFPLARDWKEDDGR